ncbi:putative helicase MAGATAMA 3, partial [Haematococcus lacustris]
PRVEELATDIIATEYRLVLALDAEQDEESKELRRKLDAGREALERKGDLLCNLKLEVLRDMDNEETVAVVVPSRLDAWNVVKEREGQHCWAMFESIASTGYTRMTAAAKALDQFLNRTPDGRVSDDELRIRQILVGDQGGQLGAQEEAAASRVSWMTLEAQAELHAALVRETVLNRAQRDNLQLAATRSFTLMQGPPGTGKSAALVSMVKALCRVFHCPTVTAPRLTQYSLDGQKAAHKLVVAVMQLKEVFSASDSSQAEQGDAVDTMCRTLRYVAQDNVEEAT